MYFDFTFCNRNIYDLKLEIKEKIMFTSSCGKSLVAAVFRLYVCLVQTSG